MKVILTGAGVEDSRSPLWGHLYLSLRSHVAEVSTFDPLDAERLALKETAEYQWRWMLDTVQPDRVIVVPSTPDADAMLLAAVAERGVVTHVLAPGELAGWQHPEAKDVGVRCNHHLFRPDEVESTVDVVLVGPANDERAEAVTALLPDRSVRVYGDGWERYSELRSVTHGALPYAHVPAALAEARVCLAVGSPLATAEAAAMNRPIARTAAEFDTATVPRAAGTWADLWRELLGQPSARVTKEGPKVTVIMGVYNVERFVGEAIESVLQQDFDDFELIVADDGSPDGSRSIVDKYLGDQRVRVFDSAGNIGQTGRFDLIWRNLQRNARGELITGIGADDRMSPERLKRQVQVFDEEPETGILFGAMRRIDDHGVRGDNWVVPVTFHSENFLKQILGRNFVTTPTFMVRTQGFFESIGDWHQGFACDYAIWLKAAGKTRFRYMPEELVEYRVHEGSASTGSSGLSTADAEGLRLMREERARHTILDCYPSLASAQTDEDWAAAYVDLGNEYLKSARATVLAEAEFDAAEELAPQYAKPLHANRALARLFQQDVDGAADAAAQAGVTLEHVKARQILYGPEVSSVPFVVSPSAMWWDGTPVSLLRLLVLIDWQQPQLAGPLVDTYVRSFGVNSPVDMMFITNGVTEEQAFAGLASILPAEDFAASMTLARCDDLAFLPVERFQHVFDCRAPGNESAYLTHLSQLARQL